ncbi:MAG TPA: hypothetical protein VNA87_07005, partial [Actinomycetota bacterium]|nr:hypothetical protein [Actinomycetota bacterium]
MTVRQSDPSSRAAPPVDHEISLLLGGELADPHSVLGAHPFEGGIRIRALRPQAASVHLLVPGEEPVPMEPIHPRGVFE